MKGARDDFPVEFPALNEAGVALKEIGLKARAPVDPVAFADPAQRESWIADKGMTVFSLYSVTRFLSKVCGRGPGGSIWGVVGRDDRPGLPERRLAPRSGGLRISCLDSMPA